MNRMAVIPTMTPAEEQQWLESMLPGPGKIEHGAPYRWEAFRCCEQCHEAYNAARRIVGDRKRRRRGAPVRRTRPRG